MQGSKEGHNEAAAGSPRARWRVPPGIFLFADDRTIQHVSPTATRPLVSVLSQQLSSLKEPYVEVRLVNIPDRGRSDSKPSVGFAPPKIADSRNPSLEELIVRVEPDEWVVRHRTSMLRKSLASFGAGDTIGMGVDQDSQSVFVVKNGRRIKSEKVSPALVADLMACVPVVVLCSEGCIVTCDLTKRPPSSENRVFKTSENLLTHNLCNSLMAFDDKHFKRLKFGNHLVAKKVGPAGLDTLHVRRALSDMKHESFPLSEGIQYFEVTFSCLPSSKESMRERNGVRSLDSRLERTGRVGLFLCDGKLAKGALHTQMKGKVLVVYDNGVASYGGQALSVVLSDDVSTAAPSKLFKDGDIVGCGFIQRKGVVMLFVNGKPLGYVDRVHAERNFQALPLAAASQEEQVILFNLGETTFSSDCSDVQQAASQHLSSSSDDSTANTSYASGHDSAVDAVLSERLEEAPKQEEDGREGWRSDELRAIMEHMEAVLSATEDAMVTTKSKVETLLELMRQSEEQVEELRELKQELLVLQGSVESLGAEKRVLEWRLKAELREKRKNEEQEEHVAMMMKKTLEQLEDAHRQIVEELDSSKSALEEELKRTVESERRLREEKEVLESRLKEAGRTIDLFEESFTHRREEEALSTGGAEEEVERMSQMLFEQEKRFEQQLRAAQSTISQQQRDIQSLTNVSASAGGMEELRGELDAFCSHLEGMMEELEGTLWRAVQTIVSRRNNEILVLQEKIRGLELEVSQLSSKSSCFFESSAELSQIHPAARMGSSSPPSMPMAAQRGGGEEAGGGESREEAVKSAEAERDRLLVELSVLKALLEDREQEVNALRQRNSSLEQQLKVMEREGRELEQHVEEEVERLMSKVFTEHENSIRSFGKRMVCSLSDTQGSSVFYSPISTIRTPFGAPISAVADRVKEAEEMCRVIEEEVEHTIESISSLRSAHASLELHKQELQSLVEQQLQESDQVKRRVSFGVMEELACGEGKAEERVRADADRCDQCGCQSRPPGESCEVQTLLSAQSELTIIKTLASELTAELRRVQDGFVFDISYQQSLASDLERKIELQARELADQRRSAMEAREEGAEREARLREEVEEARREAGRAGEEAEAARQQASRVYREGVEEDERIQARVEEALASCLSTWECLQLVGSSAAAGQETLREAKRQADEAAGRERRLEETIEELRREAGEHREEARGLQQTCEELKDVVLQSQREAQASNQHRALGDSLCQSYAELVLVQVAELAAELRRVQDGFVFDISYQQSLASDLERKIELQARELADQRRSATEAREEGAEREARLREEVEEARREAGRAGEEAEAARQQASRVYREGVEEDERIQARVEEALASCLSTWECLQLVGSSAAAGQETLREAKRQADEAAGRERRLEETIEELRREAGEHREEARGLQQTCEELKDVMLQSQREAQASNQHRALGDSLCQSYAELVLVQVAELAAELRRVQDGFVFDISYQQSLASDLERKIELQARELADQRRSATEEAQASNQHRALGDSLCQSYAELVLVQVAELAAELRRVQDGFVFDISYQQSLASDLERKIELQARELADQRRLCQSYAELVLVQVAELAAELRRVQDGFVFDISYQQSLASDLERKIELQARELADQRRSATEAREEGAEREARLREEVEEARREARRAGEEAEAARQEGMQAIQSAESGGEQLEALVLGSLRCCERLELLLTGLSASVVVQSSSVCYSKTTLQQCMDMLSLLKAEHQDCHLAYEELRNEYQRLQAELQEVYKDLKEMRSGNGVKGTQIRKDGMIQELQQEIAVIRRDLRIEYLLQSEEHSRQAAATVGISAARLRSEYTGEAQRTQVRQMRTSQQIDDLDETLVV
ncbi:hypothetical protein GUITHDRAFT_107415 [Guillardia theta CCMP2712]|uniref:B30.2/SPRY domain-containing protein n=1 Tax=Guillardia theta (strain CCMP2712) TaxID=905079 RepID=L1JDP0_GUITC|nr:hypothetical protein GUITHDRAFT_107415 [Guillardia theta CCMP2712]EKX46631.1 hypothetical protein GUITHDRAFT_107415 [Guillardia theta CCMP2712]|eukprot:XP_005833611.1 hypothetical protein GUITHDRAFT_107415 [Guillardia theta CCMP2712]